MLSPAHNEENARRAFVLRRAILLPRAVEPMAPRLHPTFSGDCPQWRTFVPAAKAASVHSCAHSAVRVGFPTPFLLGRHLAVFRPLRYPPHSILGHDSLSGPVSPQSHSYHTRFPGKVNGPPHAKRLCIAGLQKTAAAARSPLVLPEKRMYNQGQWDRAKTAGCSPGKPVRIRQRSKGRALSWKFCTRSTRRWRLWRT